MYGLYSQYNSLNKHNCVNVQRSIWPVLACSFPKLVVNHWKVMTYTGQRRESVTVKLLFILIFTYYMAMAQLVYCNLHVNKMYLMCTPLQDNLLNILANLMLSASDMSVVLHLTHFRMFRCVSMLFFFFLPTCHHLPLIGKRCCNIVS